MSGEKHSRTFWCETCKDGEPMNAHQLKVHLKTKHDLDGKVTGSKKLTCAMDGEDYHLNTYDWILPGRVKIHEERYGPK